MRKIPLKKNISRDLICEKAMELIDRVGFESASVNGIVNYANIAKGTFYIYFKNKDDLITEIFDKIFVAFEKEVMTVNIFTNTYEFSSKVYDFLASRKEFLVEVRKILLVHSVGPAVDMTRRFIRKEIDRTIGNRKNVNGLNMVAYTRIVVLMIAETCYNSIVEKDRLLPDEAKNIISDIIFRFFVVNNELIEKEA